MIFLVKGGFLLIGLICLIWGFRITFSIQYFTYWQNKYWKEKNNNQWSEKSQKINRLGTGLGAFLFGIGLIYLVLFKI